MKKEEIREMEPALVSVIMPAYNAEATVVPAIRSVLRQTYRHWELIIVDDGSRDSTISRIEEQIAEVPCSNHKDVPSGIEGEESKNHIRILRNTRNIGAAASRNRGVREARGTWIAFLDSDDIWHPDKLMKQIKLVVRKKDADIVFTGSSFIQNGTEKRLHRPKWIMEVPESVSYRQLLKQNIISCSSVLVRRDWLLRYPMNQAGLYGEMHEDYPVWLQILKAGGHAYGINEPLLEYRLSEDSRSANKVQAAFMTYHVYRYIGLGRLRSSYYFLWYAWRSLCKYRRIYG